MLKGSVWQQVVVLLFGGWLAFAGSAWGQSSFVISTPYPGVSAAPGEQVTFGIDLKNNGATAISADVAVANLPKGWQADIQGGGRAVHQVMVAPDSTESLDLKVRVPAEAREGNYRFALEARVSGSSSRLPLEVKVEPSGGGASSSLTSQYPELSGPAGATFRFRVDLRNDGSQERSYSLEAQAPPGWQVTFKPAYEDKQIASLSLKAGQSQGLDVEVKPPQGVTAGEYEVGVRAASGDSAAQLPLRIKITGTYELKLTTPSGRLNAEAAAGRESGVAIVVENTGSADLQGITFSADAPPNWAITFDPDTVETLPAGQSRQVTMIIRPDSRAIAGDYVVTATARTQETSARAEFRVMVKTPTLWGLVGVGIVAVVVAAVAWVFRKYGRR